jgi:hypothetical protein
MVGCGLKLEESGTKRAKESAIEHLFHAGVLRGRDDQQILVDSKRSVSI